MPNSFFDLWALSKHRAKEILYDRKIRRRSLAKAIAIPVGMIVLGFWVIDGWVEESVWRFLGWWGACALATAFVMLFAIYDILAVIREEREKQRSDES